MNEELAELFTALKRADREEKVIAFIEYCKKLIEYKNSGDLTEESAAYKIVGCMIAVDGLSDVPACEAIFDIAGTAELPRETSYAQPIGSWDAKTADQIKAKEWAELVLAVEEAEKTLG